MVLSNAIFLKYNSEPMSIKSASFDKHISLALFQEIFK